MKGAAGTKTLKVLGITTACLATGWLVGLVALYVALEFADEDNAGITWRVLCH